MSDTRRQALWLLATSAAANFSQVGYHRLASASLGKSYADLYVLAGVNTLALILVNGGATFLTRVLVADAVVAGPSGVRTRLQSLTRPIVTSVGLLTVALMLAGFVLVPYLHLSSTWAYLFSVSALIAFALQSTGRMALQALHQFGWFGGTFLIEAIARVPICWAFLAMGWGLNGAVLAIPPVLLISGAAAFFALPKATERPPLALLRKAEAWALARDTAGSVCSPRFASST